MCLNTCRTYCHSLFDACDECIEDAYQEYRNEQLHKALTAYVPASDDEWRKRLDEIAPLAPPSLPLLERIDLQWPD